MAEEIQHTEESSETPLNVEATETPMPNVESESKVNEENEETPMQSTEAEASSEKKRIDNQPKEKNKLSRWIEKYTEPKQVGSFILALVATIIGGLIVLSIPKIIVYFRFYSRPYITFESSSTQIIRMTEDVPNLEYSIGESRWKKLGIQSISFGGNHGKLLLRGRNKRGTNIAQITFATDAQVICTGDIRTLIDYKEYNSTNTEEACYCNLFGGCSQLVVAPDLPALKLADSCYLGMFFGCTSLKTAPVLPAKVLSRNCYSGMFYGCSSLSAITMEAVEIKHKEDFYEWLENTSPIGVFHKNKDAEWSNDSIVPKDWNVKFIGQKKKSKWEVYLEQYNTYNKEHTK